MPSRQRKTSSPLFFFHMHPPVENLQKEVLFGLQNSPKFILPKFFYDQEGSALFERITLLSEYYPTRTEISLLKDFSGEIAQWIDSRSTLIEYGCGSSEKIVILWEALREPMHYVAIDISRQPLLELARVVAENFPEIHVTALCGDFTQPIDLPLENEFKGKRVVFFPGSSIGNFEPKHAQVFLRNIAQTVGPDGGLLIGVDLKKDRTVLEAAYNDTHGVTARFNLNLLNRINRECGANFRTNCFEHFAFYNEQLGRIEMHLVSRIDQQVKIGDVTVHFAKGETIHTENSYKYSIEEFQRLAMQAGWKSRRVWTDSGRLFSIHYLDQVL